MNYIKKDTSNNFIRDWTLKSGSYFNSTKAYDEIEALIRKKERRIIEETILNLESIIKNNEAGITESAGIQKQVQDQVQDQVKRLVGSLQPPTMPVNSSDDENPGTPPDTQPVTPPVS